MRIQNNGPSLTICIHVSYMDSVEIVKTITYPWKHFNAYSAQTKEWLKKYIVTQNINEQDKMLNVLSMGGNNINIKKNVSIKI